MSDLISKTPRVNTDDHQELIDEVQRATNAVLNAALKVGEVTEAIEDHNLDGAAHPDLRQLVEEASSVSTDTIDSRVSDHNISSTAHADIRAEIQKISEDTSTITPVVNDSIAAHNADDTAHSDIREAVNNLKVQVGNINLTEVTTQITEIQQEIEESISKDIEALQSVDARHDSEIATNRDNITGVSTRITNLANDLVTIANQVTNSTNLVDDTILKAHCLERECILGYSEYNASGPNLSTVEDTLPTYVSHNKTTTFIITGAKDSAAGEQIHMDIVQGTGDYTVSPSQGIRLGDSININAGGGGNPGDIWDFTVTFTDETNSQTVKKVYAIMLARPLSSGALSLIGLPNSVEPGSEFECSVSNLTDDGSGRYSYSIDVMTSGLVFSKTSDIVETDKLTVEVPEGAERETELKFKLIVHDIYGADAEHEFSVYVNPLPSTEDFTHTVPGTVVPGRSYTIKFDGIVSAQGKKAKYNIEQDEEKKLTFSKMSNILANENVTVTIAKDAIRGKEYEFKVTTIDENDVSVQVEISTVINILPLSNDITTTLPINSQGGKTLAFIITGGSDEQQPMVTLDSGVRSVVSYDIDADKSSFNFSKVTGIGASEEIQVTLPKVASDDVRTFNIYAVDDLGERSASPKVVSITVNPIYLPVTPTITAPNNNAELEYEDGVTVSWTEFQYTTDMRAANTVVMTYDVRTLKAIR